MIRNNMGATILYFKRLNFADGLTLVIDADVRACKDMPPEER